MDDDWTLAIDLGATRAVGAVRRGDSAASLVVVDGSGSIPAGVYLDPAVGLLVGAEAASRAAAMPSFFEPSPRRRLQDSEVNLGGFDMPSVELVGAVLERLYLEACSAQGSEPSRVRLTYPAGWANSPKLGALGLAAVAAGITNVRFAPEPVAMAQHIVNVEGLAVGTRLALLDLSDSTLDCAVLENTWWGPVLIGAPGGLDPFLASGDSIAAAEELRSTIERSGLTVDQMDGVYLGGTGAGRPGLAAAVESVLGVVARTAPDATDAVALGAAAADDDVFATIGSLSNATRQAAMARNKAAGNAVMAAGAMARAAVGEDEPEGDIWWRDSGIGITVFLFVAVLVVYFFISFAFGGPTPVPD